MGKPAGWADPLLKIFSQARRSPRAERRVPQDLRIYAVGDVHGRNDLLAEMAERIAGDLEQGSFARAVTIFLGDYIDRGPGAAQVIERLSRGDWPTSIRALAGNHEDMLWAFLDNERTLDGWRALGGLETIHSYGVAVGAAMRGRDFKGIQAAFAACLPESHRRFLERLELSITIGDYFFCHAGVRPGVPLDLQGRSDLLNIRDAFLTSEAEHGKLIVHGHSPSVVPVVCRNRIGIDTAAYATHCLTCLVLEGDQRWFLHTGQA